MIKNIIKKILFILGWCFKKIKLFFKKIFVGDKTPMIMLVSCSVTMDEHILLYYNSIKHLDYDVKFVFFNLKKIDRQRYKDYNIDERMVVKNIFKYVFSSPNLIVSADLWFYLKTIFDSKMLMINHGSSTLAWGNIHTPYSYQQQKQKFDKYFESNKLVYERYNNLSEYKDRLVFVGNKYSDKFLDEIQKYDHYRNILKIDKNQKVIFLIGSFKGNSLFHQLGKGVFDLLKELSNNKKYKFIVSIHPNEYRVYDKNIEPFGKYVDELKNFNIIVREPGEDMMPFLIASDLIICDYSAMGDNAIMAEKDIVYSKFEDDFVFDLSSPAILKKDLPTIVSCDELRNIISKTYKSEYRIKILEYKKNMITPLGTYSRICCEETIALLNQKDKETIYEE